jgi:serine/threonine-protein kinase
MDSLAPGQTGWALVLPQLRRVTRGRFEIERELGQGGMAAVYLAHERALDRKVALKVMSPAVLMQQGMIERFRMEAVTIAALKHPNIVTVHGVEHHDQLNFFVLEFVEGRSLEAVLESQGPLPIAVVHAWLAQVGQALDYAHRRGVVHRDIKPGNILLDLDGNAIVTDFGIAKVEEHPTRTATGMVIGTPAYMSPEQCLGHKVSGLSDQYSLGIVAYEMLTGTPPFTGSSFTVMHAHAHEHPRLIGETRADCPVPLAQAVTRMLEKDPEKRWPSLKAALEAAGSRLPAPDGPVHHQMAAIVRGEDATAVRTSLITPETPLPRASRDAETAPSRRARALAPRLWLGGLAIATAVALWLAAPWIGRQVVGTDGQGVETGPPAAARLTISPPTVALVPGARTTLQVSVYDSENNVLTDRPVVWHSSDTTVATIAAGVVVARSAGEATITASSDGVAQPASVVVSDAPTVVSAITLTPNTLTLESGTAATLRWTVLAQDGAALTDRTPTLRSDRTSVATISPDGVVRAVGVGSATITAAIESVFGEATVTVAPAGGSATRAVTSIIVSPSPIRLTVGASHSLAARVRDRRGNTVQGALSWRSTDPNIVTVAQDGRVTATGVGTAEVVATSGGIEGRAEVTVASVPVGSVTIQPDSIGLVVGDSRRLQAAVVDVDGRSIADPVVVWRSTDQTVADVSEGTVTATGTGTALVTASSGAVMAQVIVTVAAAERLSAPAAADWSDQFATAFVAALNDAMPERNMDAIRRAWRAPINPADDQQWSEFLAVDDFRDFHAELTAAFEPERVGNRWRTDFEVQVTFRHSRGSDTWEQEYRVEFAAETEGVTVLALGLRSQRR